MSILFKNCTVIAKENGQYKELKNAYLGVENEYIDYISIDAPEKKYDREKDMSGKVLIPGLVNAHAHSAMTLVRGAGSGLPLDRWLNEAIFPIEAKMKPSDIYWGDMLASMEMLAGGTTQLAEMYDFPFAGSLAFARAGLKANMVRVGLCFDPNLEMKDWPRFDECVGLIDAINNGIANEEGRRELELSDEKLPDEIIKAVSAGRIIPDICLHSEYLTSEKFVAAIADAIADKDVRVHVHVSETKKEHEECIQRHGLSPFAYLNKMHILDKPTYAAHCVWVSEEDMDIMKEKGVTIVHNPTSNLKLGSGIAPISAALDKGINVALGTDGVASNNNVNMFEEIHLAALLQKGANHNPELITDAQVFDMATAAGAKALGRPDTGSLEVGKKADIVALDFDKPHLIPNADTLAMLSYSVQASDVCMTMVDGKILYENGEFYTIDREKVISELKKCVNRLL